MNNIHVRVTGSKEKENGFSPVETPCWAVELVNDDTGVVSGVGERSQYFYQQEAENQAKAWAEFLGCGIRYFEISQRTITDHVEVFKTKRVTL